MLFSGKDSLRWFFVRYRSQQQQSPTGPLASIFCGFFKHCGVSVAISWLHVGRLLAVQSLSQGSMTGLRIPRYPRKFGRLPVSCKAFNLMA